MVQTGRMPNLAPPARYDLPWKAVRGQAVFGPVTVQASLEAEAHNRFIQCDQLDDDLARTA